VRRLETTASGTEPPSAFRLAVVGSRDWPDQRAIWRYLEHYRGRRITIVTGSDARASLQRRRAPAGGIVDHTAAVIALAWGFNLVEYPAEWGRYGKRAGMMRNGLIAEDAHAVVAFWDGRSSGTRSTLRIAFNTYLPIRVFLPGGKTWACQRTID
jgi:hypothetical protein